MKLWWWVVRFQFSADAANIWTNISFFNRLAVSQTRNGTFLCRTDNIHDECIFYRTLWPFFLFASFYDFLDNIFMLQNVRRPIRLRHDLCDEYQLNGAECDDVPLVYQLSLLLLLCCLLCLSRRTILSQLMGDQSAVVMGHYAGHSVGRIAAIGPVVYRSGYQRFTPYWWSDICNKRSLDGVLCSDERCCRQESQIPLSSIIN